MNTQDLYPLYLACSDVTTDSRQVPEGSMFFALKGPNFNGNAYAAAALEAGAAYAVVDEPVEGAVSEKVIQVEDVLKALQQLANYHRQQFHGPLLAITGSNGKTTTKELISKVMNAHYRTHWTKGNLNNHIGVPLTLLAMPLNTEFAVIEMGANHQGEIAALCEIAEPTHGMITNIGKAHLEGFGGIEGVKKGKSELYKYLETTGGLAFVNADDPVLMELSGALRKRVYYQRSAQPDLSVPAYENILQEERPFVKVGFLNKADGALFSAQSNLPGVYNFYNICAAIAIGKYFKVPGKKIKRAIEGYKPENNRSQLKVWQTNTFIMDAYNANPTSVEHALRNFAGMEAANKWVILGDMLELGDESEQEHIAILSLAEELGLHQRILVGPVFGAVCSEKELHFENAEAMTSWFREQSWENTWILLKGSRGIRLEKLTDTLLKESA